MRYLENFANLKSYAGSIFRKIIGKKNQFDKFNEMKVANQRNVNKLSYKINNFQDPEKFPRIGWLDEIKGSEILEIGLGLRKELNEKFKKKYHSDKNKKRILIFQPDYNESSAGHSLFTNFWCGLDFIGVKSRLWNRHESLYEVLESFKPNVFLTIHPGENKNKGHPYYKYIDWNIISNYRRKAKLDIGFVVDPYEKTIEEKDLLLRTCERYRSRFLFSFACDEFNNRAHSFFINNGLPVVSLEFSANPLKYFPVPWNENYYDFTFMGSAHFEKWEQYFKYLLPLFENKRGAILGPFWGGSVPTILPDVNLKYFICSGRVGLNLHVPFQLNFETEINERAYNIAACGVAQVSDCPPRMRAKFGQSVLCAKGPHEYLINIDFLINDKEKASTYALDSMKRVLESETIFHRAENFVSHLERVVQ